MPKNTIKTIVNHKDWIIRNLNRISSWVVFIAVVVVVYDYGFNQHKAVQVIIRWFYLCILVIETLFICLRYIIKKNRPKKIVWAIDFILLVLILSVLSAFLGLFNFPILKQYYLLNILVILSFAREFSLVTININKFQFTPAFLFLLSFLILILLGSLFLLLPNATYNGISLVDAFFTSTSAVCVTGLIVVDTGSYFTQFGQIIILILIQLGGIGIMTFTSYFSYFFKGEASYQSQLMLKDITNTEKITSVFATLKKVIILTILIETFGAFFIYTNLAEDTINEGGVFFSIFHSISAFCNAGFSTLQGSFYESAYRFNYSMHLVISFLFIIGGLGFPIIFNFLRYIKHIFVNRLFRQKPIHIPWVININTRIVVITTLALLLFGSVMFFISEYNNTLSGHNLFGKIIASFFGAATPRTAGFNTIDTSAIGIHTALLIMFLMWVGASPGSTGGGVKTSSFALSILNVLSIAKGKDRVEIYRREIADISLHRAFAIITLSIIAIGVATLLISFIQPGFPLHKILFETISAYSTVGLSMGITAELNTVSKLIVIITMFVGRVSFLTILIAFIHKTKFLNYRYPSEKILIN